MARHRILICGTNYGRVYVEAIRALPAECELVGLLARGSDRSRQLARNLDVPLYLDPDDLPAELDAACVAVPSSETDLIPSLLERGVDVLSDHPVALGVLNRSLSVAATHHRRFHVNAHFSQLEAAQAFVEASRRLRSEADPVFVDALVGDRLLYGALDTLRQALGALEPIDVASASAGPQVRVAAGELGGIPCSLQVQLAGAPGGESLTDGSPEYFADLRISLSFTIGTLTLLSLAGPLTWTWNFTRGAQKGDELAPSQMYAGASMEDLRGQRARENRDAVRRLIDSDQGSGPPAEQDADYLREVTRSWERLGAALRT